MKNFMLMILNFAAAGALGVLLAYAVVGTIEPPHGNQYFGQIREVQNVP